MKSLKLAVLLLSFTILTGVHAQTGGDEIILPSEGFGDELFDEPPLPGGGDEPIFLELDEPDEPEFEEQAAPAAPSSLPASATTTLSVINISQNNANALEVGARSGDILRYSLEVDSQSDDVKEYLAEINVSALEAAVNFTDVGLGTLSAGVLSFPEFSQAAPCNKVYTFFVQVKEDCGELNNVTVTAEGNSVTVNLNCGLSQTGPSSGLLLWVSILLLAAIGMLWQSSRNR